MYLKKLLFIVLSLCAHRMTAQVVGDLLQITLQDQSSINGKLIEKKGDDWVIETKSVGNISLKRQNIVHFVILTTSQSGSFKTPAPPHYWSAHTAIPLEKGEGYYQAGELIFHSVNYGFTKYFSVSGGLELLSLVSDNFFRGSGSSSLPVFAYVSPRFSYPVSPNFYLSTGILFGRDENGELFNGMTNSLNILYVTATLGNRNHNLSFTYGHRLEKIPKIRRFSSSFPSEIQDMNFIGLAGKVRLSEKWTILSEAWSWTSAFSEDRTSFVGTGARYSARRFHFGFGILTPFFEGQLEESIPILTFGFPFRSSVK
jgi:hypothetical protein